MNKRKLSIIFGVVVCVLVIILFVARNNSDLDYTDMKDKEYYTENENSIKIDSNNPITELNKKTINVGVFQSAEITVSNYLESGNIEVEIFDVQNEEIQSTSLEYDSNKKIFNINEGLGKYTIVINTHNYIGNCVIEWNIKENNNSELFTSTMGYELKYDPDKFSILYDTNGETFIYNENNEIYFKVYSVSKEKAMKETEVLFQNADQTGLYEISQGTKSGEYTLQKLKEKNMIKRNLILEFSDDSLLILEICELESTEKIQKANEYIKNMIQTFIIK